MFSIAVVATVLHFDFSFVGDFLSTAEMFYALYLFDAPINEVFCEFLISLKVHKRFPNFILFFVDDFNRRDIGRKYRKFGYKSQMAFVNLGIQISIFACIVFVWFAVYLLKRVRKLKDYLNKLYQNITYGSFLRFWLQTFFETLIAASLSLRTFLISSPYDKFDLSASFIFCVIFT